MKLSRNGINFVVEFTPSEYINMNIGLDCAVESNLMPKNNGVHQDVERMTKEIYKSLSGTESSAFYVSK